MADGALPGEVDARVADGAGLGDRRPQLPAAATPMSPARAAALHRQHQRIGGCRLENRMAERQVDDVDLQDGPVLDDVVEAAMTWLV
jgi:hypothetical protein